MKLAKKIIALMVVLCTLGAMMIPGVSAADNDLVVTFSGKTDGDFAKLGFAASTNLSTAANLEIVNNAYKAGTIQWGIHALDTRSFEVRTNTLYLRMRQYSNATHAHVALSFKVAVDGNYFLNLGYYQYEAKSDRVGAYIIETPEEALTNNNGTLRTKVAELKKNGDPLVAFPGDSATGTYAAENTIALKAEQEYLLILFSETADKATDSRDWFTGFSLVYDSALTPDEPEVPDVPVEPEEPEIEQKTDNLTVSFKDDLVAAGQTGSGSFKSYYNSNTNPAYNAGTINWVPYGANRDSLVHGNNVSPATNGGAFSFNSAKTKAWLELSAQEAGVAFAALKFRAPGTGNYKLSIDYSKRSSSTANPTEGGAYILAIPEGGYTSDTLPGAASELAMAKVVATVGTAGTYTSAGTAVLEADKEYIIVFYSENAAAGSVMYYTGFSLTYQAAEASIAGKYEGTLAGAVEAAAAGDVIKLGADVTITELNLPDDVTLDLAGKTLTADAVVGKVTDSADGAGLIATGKESVVNAAAGQVALWDNNEFAPGYRVFNYTFNSLKVTDDEDNVTAVSENINFYSFEENILDTKDTRLSVVSSQIKTAYDNGDIDWRIEMATNTYQSRPNNGNNCFSSGTKTLRYNSNKGEWLAIRFRSPGEGNISTSIKVDSSNTAIYDAYIIKADELKDYAAHSAAFSEDIYQEGGTTEIFKEYKAAVEAAIADEQVVLSVDEAGVTKTFTGAYEFEADTEYVIVLKATTGGQMRLADLSFTRAAKQGDARTFWSTLQFSNTLAYTLINTKESGLKLGYEMDWNGAVKSFQYDDATLAAWAADSAANTEATYGLYIRISGFEALTESGVLTGKAYLTTGAETVYAGGEQLSYEFNV